MIPLDDFAPAAPTMELDRGVVMALLKTVGVLIVAGLVLWIVFALVHFLASTILLIIELAIIIAIIVLVYRHFNKPKTTT